MIEWLVAQTGPQAEAQADRHLRRQGFSVYLPRYLRLRRHARRQEWVPRPLFPRYLFVGIDPARSRWRSIRSTFGISHLVCAGDRPLPVPSEISMWPNFRSPLVWDVFAVTTYALVSALFWYVGLLPDLATWRDRATTPFRRRIFGLLSLGWRGSHRQWHHYEKAYLLLAGLATALVVSVHSIVSFDFAVSNVPGWHSTIFPPYFVAGAMFSGFAMVVTLPVVVRRVFDLQHLITLDVLEKMNRVILATSLIVGYAYGVELFIAWYSGNPYERFAFVNRAFGPYGWAYGTMVSCNVLVPQLFWWKRVRRSIPAMLGIAILVNVGMWFERFVIIVTALHRDYLPSSWGYFRPTLIDFLTFIGSVGLFFTLILLFVRVLPIVAMTEVKGAMKHESELEV